MGNIFLQVRNVCEYHSIVPCCSQEDDDVVHIDNEQDDKGWYSDLDDFELPNVNLSKRHTPDPLVRFPFVSQKVKLYIMYNLSLAVHMCVYMYILIGKWEQAHLVVQPPKTFYIYTYTHVSCHGYIITL